MDKTLKTGSEITVRLSLTLQEAPDVHTLLAMTPVRQRAKLVRLALERYIVETGHPAGNVETQIAAISAWLRARSEGVATSVVVEERPAAILPLNVGSIQESPETVPVQRTTASEPAPVPTLPLVRETDCASSMESPSMQRWLNT